MQSFSAEEVKQKIASRPFWYHRIIIPPGVETPGMNDCAETLNYLTLPKDMSGMRVLDIGAAEGFFTYECERRGAAEVIAVDYNPPELTGFAMVRELMNSKATHRVDSIYNLRPRDYGTFDVILFLGILYHLPDPVLALSIVRDLCKPSAFLFMETQTCENQLMTPDGKLVDIPADVKAKINAVPLMQYFVGNKLNPVDYTNFWGPNIACVREMLRDTCFTVTSHETNRKNWNRTVFNCRVVEPDETIRKRDRMLRHAHGRLLG